MLLLCILLEELVNLVYLADQPITLAGAIHSVPADDRIRCRLHSNNLTDPAVFFQLNTTALHTV